MKMIKYFAKKVSSYGLLAFFIISLQSCNQPNKESEIATTEEIGEEDILEEGNSDLAEAAYVETNYFVLWDKDNSGLLEEEEVMEGWNIHIEEDLDEGFFEEWDENANEGLEEDEFISGFYSYYDENDDELLDENEFSGLASTNYYNSLAGDSDGLSEEELTEGWDFYFPRTAYGFNFTEWDADEDGILNEGEFSEGIFDAWDANKSGLIEEDEFEDNYIKD